MNPILKHITKNLLDELLNRFKIIQLNNILAKLHYMLFFVGIIIICIALIIRTYKKAKVIRREHRFNIITLSKALNKNKIIYFFVRPVSNSISFFNSYDKDTNDFLGLGTIIIYLTVVYSIIIYLNKFAFLWYTKTLNIIIALMLPNIILNSLISIRLNKLAKELPYAFEEILSAWRSTKRIRKAIPEALEYMPKSISREFTRLNRYIQSENTFAYGLAYLKKRMNNKFVDLFCSILEYSHFNTSDITLQLEILVLKAKGRNYIREKTRRQLVWYRILVICMLLLIPSIMNFVSTISVDAYNYYHTIEGGVLLTATIISGLIAYVILLFMEK